MIGKTMEAEEQIFTTLFNDLLNYSIYLQAWKQAKFLPIPKPGRTDWSIPKNLDLSRCSCASAKS